MPSSHFPPTGGTGGTISGTIGATQVAYGASSDTIAGSADLTFDGTSVLSLGDYLFDADARHAAQLSVIWPIANALFLSDDDELSYLYMNVVDGTTVGHALAANTVGGSSLGVTHDSAGFDVSASMYGVNCQVLASGDSVIDHLVGYYVQPQVLDTSVVTGVYGHYFAPLAKAAGATITNSYAYYSVDLLTYGTHPYFLWYDGGPGGDANGAGVFRVNEFGILAYYNPAFTKYTPGLANFEREILRWGDTGVYGTDNVAYIGVEAGGTGTNRVLSLTGASVQAETVPGTFAFMKAKLQTSTNATTGLVAGVLAATTNASIVITDASGQAYRVPCII